MDYTKIRQLIYCNRQDISEFGIYEDCDFKVNPFLYERLKKVSYLHPSYDYANSEMLRIFNDVYFILTAFFMDERPLANYANYRRIANPNNERNILSNNRSLVEICMLYVILNRFNGANWFREKKTHSEFFNVIRDEVYKYRNPQDVQSVLDQLRGAENIAYTITGECESMRFFMSVKEDFPPRDIQEVINSGESLKECLFAGKNISEAVNSLCKDKKQKLKLIERLLEAEKEDYGVMDPTICAAYKSLYELKSDLTGEPLPEKMRFDRAGGAIGPPLMPSSSLINENNAKDTDSLIIQNLRKELNKKNQQLKVLGQRLKEVETKLKEKEYQPEETKKETLDWLEDWQQLSTRELAIFFAQALGVSFDPKLINQNQLANIAAMWTKPQSDTIRSKIGNLFKEEQKVNKGKLDFYPPKTKDEALDVYYFIMRVAKHYSSITPQMNKMLDNLNEQYNLGIVERVDENNKEKQVTKKDIFDEIDKARKSGEKKGKS